MIPNRPGLLMRRPRKGIGWRYPIDRRYQGKCRPVVYFIGYVFKDVEDLNLFLLLVLEGKLKRIVVSKVVGIAIFPTTPAIAPSGKDKIIGGVHLGGAAVFFLTLIYYSLFLFTKTDPRKMRTYRKVIRNRVYQVCGNVMLVSIILIIAYHYLPNKSRLDETYHPLYFLESILVVFFGVSWIVKGGTILSDVTK